MAVTSGFFNSVNHDRLYNAEQISSMFDGIILDGIYQGLGDAFIVKPYSELNCTVTVGTGRAWFDHTWTLNSTELALTLDDPNVLYDRIDAIVIDVDRRQDVRANSIKVVKGTVSETGATKPTLIEEELHNQYPLAYVTVKAGSAAPIQAQYIENVIGQTKTPLVAGVLESMDITMFVQQMEDEFNVWFEGLKDVVSGDSITNLQQQINEINEYIEIQKSVSIDGEGYQYSQNAKISVYNLARASNEAFILPDGNIVCVYVSADQFMHIKIINQDGIQVSDTTTTCSSAVYGGSENIGRTAKHCLMYCSAESYPATALIGIPKVRNGGMAIDVLSVTVTSDHAVNYSIASSSSGTWGDEAPNLNYSAFCDTPARFSDGSCVCMVIWGNDTTDTPGLVCKTNGSGVVVSNSSIVKDGYAQIPFNNLNFFNLLVKKDDESKIYGFSHSSNVSGTGWSVFSASTLHQLNEGFSNSTIPANNTVALNQSKIVSSSDSSKINIFENSYNSISQSTIKPFVQISSSLTQSSSFGNYKTALSSDDEKVLLCNFGGNLMAGLSFNEGLLCWTKIFSNNGAMDSINYSNGNLAHKYLNWNNENTYIFLIDGYLNLSFSYEYNTQKYNGITIKTNPVGDYGNIPTIYGNIYAIVVSLEA